MPAIAPSRARAAAFALSVACLVLVITTLGLSPSVITGISGSAAGPAFGAATWFAPSLLALSALYRVRSDGWGFDAFVLGGLGVLTLATFLLNLRTVVASPVALTYGGDGAFFGPLLTLALGSAIALVVLAEATASAAGG
ncbi:hypothetical protein C464_09517 [Halorubrum coriense DSM 10284]|uniref:Uncharacterized protein n=1 Tax=Halorubrum coriense DSM 10284 TaxID=1227466 RepID=M0EL66_9EURY|nr:hypothetical protein [Halorubrum coriense]ELZ47159.1 hypothetical protein C464_09517 [Halorubrum coriense DSM 10284]